MYGFKLLNNISLVFSLQIYCFFVEKQRFCSKNSLKSRFLCGLWGLFGGLRALNVAFVGKYECPGQAYILSERIIFANFTAKLNLQMKGITIAYDAKRAVANFTGLGNYSRNVIGAMSALYPDHHYLLMAPRMKENPRLEPILMRENIEVVTPSGWFDQKVPSLWRSAFMSIDLANHNADVYHGLSNEIPLSGLPCPSVVTIHDLIWRRVPQDYKAIDRKLYEFKYRRSAQRATRIIAISECTKRDIVEFWGINPEKIDVIYQGCDPLFLKPINFEEKQRIRSKYNLPERYAVSVGTVQSRKNQMLAVKALEGLPEDFVLIIVGGGDARYKAEIMREIEQKRLGDRVRWLESVPFDDLPGLYHCALFSSYTSRYEGFGIPPVESLTVGTPVIACTGSCLEEAGGEGAIYVDPDDTAAYVEAANKLIEQSYLRDKLAQKGRRHVAKFNTKDFATSMMKTYNKAIIGNTLNNLK